MVSQVSRRFYMEARVELAEDGYAVTLDGRPVLTPSGTQVVILSSRLADAIACEWAEQKEEIVPTSMPLTQLAVTAIDRVGPGRAEVINNIARYGATDLLCYRAEAPADLVRQQEELWQPLLDWVAKTYGARLQVTFGIIHTVQEESALVALRAAVNRHNEFELTALAEMTQICSSVVIGLAVTAGHIAPETAFETSLLDETWQSEQWGSDFDAEARRAAIRSDLQSAARFIDLLRD